jgi:hypothetical protein
MAMQTKVAEMLGVKFAGWAFSHCRDTVVAVTDEDGGGRGNVGAGVRSPECLTSERTWTVLHDKLPSGLSPAMEQSRSLTGKPARTRRGARAGRADSRDRVVAPTQSSMSSERQARMNHFATQFDSISRHAGHTPGWTDNGRSTAGPELDMIIEFIEAGGLLGEVVGQ